MEILHNPSGDAIDYADVTERIKRMYTTCNEMEKKQLHKILVELSEHGYSQTYEQMWLADFKEVPVSIDQFLCDPLYLGNTNDNGNMVYPGWRPVYRDVFNSHNEKHEVILSGATRIGKTSTAVSMMAYMTYLIMCYRNPQKYFGLKAVSRVTVAFANLTKDLAQGVAFREYNDTLRFSPWFMEHGSLTNSTTKPVYIPEGNQIELVTSSDAAHLLGMQLWACIIDEVNFNRAGVKDITISKAHMNHLYNTAMARITGTFQLHGQVYGKLFTCSSKNSDNDYLTEHIETQINAGNTHMYLFDKPQWEVLPDYRFSPERFHITVGDRYKRGFVIPSEVDDEEHRQDYINQGYKILEVPKNYEPNFRADYDIALRDIAGISVIGAMGFITQEMITPNVTTERKNPFFMDYYEIGTRDNDTLERHFHIDAVPQNLRRLPMHIHIDFAEVSDHIGICGAVQDGTKNVFDYETEKKVMMPFFREIFQVAIGAPRGDRMSFQKVINFIVWLKKSGFNIGMVSTDQYQSSYVRENLAQQGFTTDKISVDKTADPYISLRNALQDQRLELIKCELQETELVHLQRNGDRIDHPPQSSSSSAIPCLENGYNAKGIGKDNADALCGCITTLIASAPVSRPPTKHLVNAMASVNGGGYRSGNGRINLPMFGSQYRKF